MINRFLPIILLFGILLNFCCVVIFRLRLDRQYIQRFEEYQKTVDANISSMVSDSLSMIDGYFASNYISSASSSSTSNSSVLYETISDWSFTYFESDGYPFAKSGSRYYTVGDIYPRGGVITDIHPDGIVIDGHYWVSNSRNDSSNIQLPKINKEVSKNEYGTNSRM